MNYSFYDPNKYMCVCVCDLKGLRLPAHQKLHLRLHLIQIREKTNLPTEQLQFDETTLIMPLGKENSASLLPSMTLAHIKQPEKNSN